MTERELLDRTKMFALRVIALVSALPRGRGGQAIGNQLIRSGTSVGANYRAACRSRSRAELIAKLGVVEEEADESAYWLKLIIEAGLLKETQVSSLLDEADQLTRIIAASRITLKSSRDPQSQFANRNSQFSR